MNLPTSEIDRVVREVLAELGAAGATAGLPRSASGATAGLPSSAISTVGQANRGAPAPDENAKKREGGGEKRDLQQTSSSGANATDGELFVTARVVSTHELLGRLDSVRRVVVSKGAVVTPAVRDELLRRGIDLACADSADAGKPPLRLAMTVAASDFDATPLADAMQREGFRAERSQSDCLIEAVDRLAQETSRPDTLGVLLTVHAAAGLCLANRLRGVRAVGAGHAASAADVGANLLVVDPRAGSYFQLKQIVAEFARGGVHPCPAVFRERLM